MIAYNDQLAIGLIRGLAALRTRVPADVSVIGFDNIFAADLITPGLTTVAAPLRTQGVTAVRNLLAIFGGAKPRAGEPVVLPVKLVVRGSADRCATNGRGSEPGPMISAAGTAPHRPAE